MQSIGSRFRENAHLFITAGAVFLLIYLSSFVRGYGYFIDEFYYIACASNPSFGYVDHPPLAPFALTIFQFLFGDSLYAIRILPALATSASVILVGVLTKEIGGGKFAQFLAACSMATAPMVIAFGGFYSMNAFEPLLAIVLLYYVIRMIRNGDGKEWVQIGVVMGLGVMNKHTFGLFILALFFSLLFTGYWRLFLNRWFVWGSLLGAVIVIPNIVWQMLNGYPSIEFYRNISADKNVYTPPGAFIMGQVMGMSPFNVLVWLPGTLYLLFSKQTKRFRFLAVLFLLLFIFMMISGTSRSDRMIFAYPAVLTGGGLFFENVVIRYHLRFVKGIIITLLIIGLGLGLPLILPYFGYETVKSYVSFIGFNTEIEKGKKPPLPQLLADRIGWGEKFELVLHAYQRLSDEENKEVIIASGNYGDAGMIDLFGKRFGLPPSVCNHNNYYLWSKERLHGSIVLYLTQKENFERLKQMFAEVIPGDEEFINQYVSAHENHLTVFLCKEPTYPLSDMLDRGKNYH
jgi:hypothetical protein